MNTSKRNFFSPGEELLYLSVDIRKGNNENEGSNRSYVIDLKEQTRTIFGKTEKRIMDGEKIKRFTEALNEIGMQDWKHEQVKNYEISWTITIMTKKNTYDMNGYDSYPERWNEFCKLIKELAGFKILK